MSAPDSSIQKPISANWLTKGVIAVVFSLLGIILTAALYSSFTRQASAEMRMSAVESRASVLESQSVTTARALDVAKQDADKSKQEQDSKVDKLTAYVVEIGKNVQAIQTDVAVLKSRTEK